MRIEEQEEIIELKNKNLIVSASAGSGKTTVMIRKILKYILDGDCKTNQLLVLTYTKAAGQEMKKKLVDKYKENLNEFPFLQDELDLVPSSDISTIDSFCQKLVKRYFYKLEIDPSFSILEGSEQNYLQEEALKDSLKTIKIKNPEKYEVLLENLSSNRDESNIKKNILIIYNYLTSLLNYEDFINKSKDFYAQDKKIAESFLNNYYNKQFNSLKNKAELLKNQADQLEFEKYVLYLNKLIIDIERFVAEKDFAKKIELEKESYENLYVNKNDQIGLKDKISNTKKAFDKILLELKEQYISGEVVESSYDYCRDIIDGLFELLKIFMSKYKDLKTSLNSYDFNDIERLTIKLLEDEQICDEIKKSYKYIFVDEFQDANSIQEKIINSLANNNLFFVGDTKQSIYAFRQSDPEIFLNIEKEFKNSNNAESKNLNCNFRTNKNILDFINRVFDIIMTEQTCGLNYERDSRFNPQAEYEDLDGEVCVELNLLNMEEDEQKDAPTKVYSVKENEENIAMQTKTDKQALFICNKIVELLGQEIYDKDTQSTKPITFKDITILLAKRGEFVNCLCKHFQNIKIPYVVNLNENLEEVYDNQVLFNLIKYSLNRYDDYALYCVLSSALFNFSDYELAYLKQNSTNTKYFYETLNQELTDQALKQKLKNFDKTISEFLFNLKYKGIYYSLDKIVKQTNYLLNISYEDNFEQRKSNILNYINSFLNSKFNFDVCEYVNYRESTLRNEKVQAEKNFIEAVEITTMHSSKGLEYPVVIIPNLNQDFTKDAEHSEIKINKNFGIGIKSFNMAEHSFCNGIFYNACNKQNKENELAEKIRLLYVATTRAKNKLILIGENTGKFTKFLTDFDVQKCNNYCAMFVQTLNQELIDKINLKTELDCEIFNNPKLKLLVNNVVANEISFENPSIPKQEDFNLIESLKEFLLKDNSVNIRNIALKNSVSEFAFDENSSINFSPNNLTISEHLSQTTSQIGTLYHLLLEKIDFNEVNNLEDIEYFVKANFSEEENNIFLKIGYQNIFNNISLLKTLVNPKDKLLKEQKFVMCVPYNKIVEESDITDKILIQGIIDLIIIKDDKILLVDYKQTSKNSAYIKDKYKKQLYLYEYALKNRFKNIKIEKKILNLVKNEFILM